MAAYKNRIERQEALLRLIPTHGRKEDCPTPATLLERLAGLYADCASPAAGRRAIQRDLEELACNDRIEAVNPRGKPLRYRRARDEDDAYLRDYAREFLRAVPQLMDSALSLQELETVLPELRDPERGLGLGDDKLRIIGDTQRLRPPALAKGVLGAVLEALANSRTLQVLYQDRTGTRTQPTLHPQALLQRGPRLYLFALKNNETEPVRTYALHRFLRAEVGSKAARSAPDFDLQATIDSGEADFGSGELLELRLRVRGYVADLLRECPLSAEQIIEDEPEGSDFDAQVRATIPGTGQLLRWVLGCGDKAEVLEPEEYRHVLRVQVAKIAEIYGVKG